jgi:hypothetical protein
MRTRYICGSVTVMLLLASAVGSAQNGSDKHVLVRPTEVKWMPPPVETGVPAAVGMVVVSGNPGEAGSLFSIRLKLPTGAKFAPHWHPGDEHVVVLSGSFAIGMGERFDSSALEDMPQGSYVLLPKEMRHFALARTDAVVQVYGIGPFVLNYVNKADDPRVTGSR